MRKKSRAKSRINSEEFDRLFDDAQEDVTSFLDSDSVMVNRPVQRINLDIPVNLLKQIDREAQRIGVARTALLKVWISDRLNIETVK